MITLKDFDHLRDDPRVRFKSEIVNGRDLTIISYMIADAEFWDLPLAKECRGITFDTQTGECVCLPFEKFFNVGERPETQRDKLDFTNIEILEKRDGSMLTPVLLNDRIFWKTKKSFFSEVAISAANSADPDLELFCREMIEMDYTPIFEFTHPDHRIVLDYGTKPSFTLLALRNIRFGFYVSYDIMFKIASLYNIYCISKFDITPMEMFDQMATLTQFEGYVVVLDKNNRVKQKTDWYFRMHVLVTQMRERDVAEAVAKETIDDIKSALVAEGKDLTPILEIEQRVVSEIEDIRLKTEELFAKIKVCDTRKDAALAYSKDPNFGLAMKMYDGREPDYVNAWTIRELKNVSLRCIYNASFGGDN